jgi:hypothetical protein
MAQNKHVAEDGGRMFLRTSTRLHDVTSQNSALFIASAIKTSNITDYVFREFYSILPYQVLHPLSPKY